MKKTPILANSLLVLESTLENIIKVEVKFRSGICFLIMDSIDQLLFALNQRN